MQRTKWHLSNGIEILHLPPILERILKALLTTKQIPLQRNQAKAAPVCLLMVLQVHLTDGTQWLRGAADLCHPQWSRNLNQVHWDSPQSQTQKSLSLSV